MTVLADIPKNARETIRVVRDQYQGHELVHIRVWFSEGDGELKPTKKGLAFRTDQLPQVIEALQKAQEAAP